MTIGIVGCGNLGLSLLNGIRQNDCGVKIIGSRRNISELQCLNIPNTVFTASNSDLIKESDIVIIALKPYNVL
ncbi:MAG: pyrroline-5-carboxylate reductase family protein, partial [Flavobacteriales bacterium]